jgi:hypothetical protein
MPKEHRIRKGDSISSLAEHYGLFEKTIWTDGDNAALRELRPNMNILSPGDVVVIPDKDIVQETCAADTKHRFKRKGVPAIFRVQLFQFNEPRDNQDYSFDIDGNLVTGKTDANGIVEETLSPSAKKGLLRIGSDEAVYEFQFGALEPIDAVKGVAQRLQNLGIYDGKLDVDANDVALIFAIKSFQMRYELDANGEIDQATLDKLAIVHDVE